jgi:signal peptidase II
VFLITLVVGTVIDQLTKWWVIQNIRLSGVHPSTIPEWSAELPTNIPIIPGFLDLVHRQNPGAAFSFLADFEYRHYLFLTFSVIATVIVLDLVRRLPKTDVFMSMTLGLILSGAFGNAIDRVRQKVVTDFIRVYTDNPDWVSWLRDTFGTAEYPSFNVADANLVVGVLLFLIYTTFFDDTKEVPDAEGLDTSAEGEATAASTPEASEAGA